MSPRGFADLIEALQIFKKYGEVRYPTSCEYDTLYINRGASAPALSEEDQKRLLELGFQVDRLGDWRSDQFS